MSEKILIIKGREFVGDNGYSETDIQYRCNIDSKLKSHKSCVLSFWGAGQKQIYEKLKSDYEILLSGDVYNMWFEDVKSANIMNQKINELGEVLNLRVVTNIIENNHVRYKTLFECDMKLPNGEVYTYVDNFGYGYPVDTAVFSWLESNNACACNRSLCLQHVGVCIEEQHCGDSIVLDEFRVYLEMLD